MVSVAMQDLVSVSFQVFSYEQALQLPALLQPIQEPLGFSIALADPQERISLTDDKIRCD